MLSRPLWRQSTAGFRGTLRDWIHGGDPAGLINLASLPRCGRGGRRRDAAGGRRAPMCATLVSDSDAFYARFASAVEQFGAAWWTRLPGLSGRAAAEIDLKKLGISPIVHGVRTLALQYHVPALGTADRLRALAAQGRIDEPLARDLVDALHFLMGMKLANNLRQIAEGRQPDNGIRLPELGTLERHALKDSLTIVRHFKQWLGRHYRLGCPVIRSQPAAPSGENPCMGCAYVVHGLCMAINRPFCLLGRQDHMSPRQIRRGPSTQVLLALFAAGMLLLNFPLLIVFDRDATILGLPLLPVALFAIWAVASASSLGHRTPPARSPLPPAEPRRPSPARLER